MKVKAKLKGDVVKVKAMFKNPMAGVEEAEKKKIKPEFISQITGVHNGAVVYEVTTGGFISKNPLFKFEFKGGKKGEFLELTTIDNNGKKETKKAKIK
jgi:sulfur-oxidizing protein SoxZ